MYEWKHWFENVTKWKLIPCKNSNGTFVGHIFVRFATPPPPFCFVFFKFKRNYILAYNSKRYHPKCNFWANFILNHVKKTNSALAWCILLFIDNDICHHSGQNFFAVPGEFMIFKSIFRSHPCLRAEISIAWHIEASSFICTLRRQISQSDYEITAGCGNGGARRA